MKSTDPNAVSAYIEVEDSTYTSGEVGIWLSLIHISEPTRPY